jgi:hypothetical protein
MKQAPECASTGNEAKPQNWLLTGPALVLYVALTKLLIQLAVAGRYGYSVDELYFLACAEHLDWGYVDHPPLVVWVAHLVHVVSGDSLYSLRLLPALAGAALAWLTGALTRELGGGRYAQLLAAIAVLGTPFYLTTHSVLGMNAFEPLLWVGCAYCAVLAIAREQPRYWIWFGIIVGVGLLNKYSILLFAASIVLGLLLTPARRWLKTPQMWAGGALAMLIVSPNLVWQIQHDLPFLQWQHAIRGIKQTIQYSPVQFVLHQLWLTGAICLVWLTGLWFFFADSKGKSFRALDWAFVASLGCLVAMHGKPYYLLPVYGVLFAGGAVALEAVFANADLAWLRRALVYAVLLVCAILAPTFIPVLPLKLVIPYERAFRISPPLRDYPFDHASELPPAFAWEQGWRDYIEAVSQTYHALPPAEQAKAGILTRYYGQAASIDFFGSKYGLPKAISGHLSYYFWGTRNNTGEILLVIGYPPNTVANVCDHAELGALYKSDNPDHGVVVVCKGLHAKFPEDWPKLRSFF